MRAVMLEVPPGLLDERRRLDLDRADEMWEGVLHMVPPPLDGHEHINTWLFLRLAGRADEQMLIARGGTPGLYRADDDWRVPDQLYARHDQLVEQRFRGAELVVEIRSPGDESYEKLAFFAAVRVPEVLIVTAQPRSMELFRLGDDGSYSRDATGHSTVLDAVFAANDLALTIDGVTHRL